MRITRAAVVGAASLTAILLLAGCGSGGGASASFEKKVSGTLNAWAFDSADDVGKARLDYANEQLESAGAKVELDATTFDAQKFATRTASGKVPDVVQMSSQSVTTYAAQGLIMPLSKCYDLYGVDPSEYFYKQVAADVSWDDDVWGVPQFYQPPAILVDRTVADAAGVSLDDLDVSKGDDFIAAVAKLTQKQGDDPTVIGFDPQGVDKAGLWMLGFGGRLVDDDGKPALDDAKNVEAVEFLQKVYDAQGGYAKVKSLIDSFDLFGDGNQFVKHQVGAEVFDQWYVNVLSGYRDQISLAAVPFRDQQGEPFAVASGQAFVIPAKAKNPSAACKWVLDVTSAKSWDAAAAARQKTLDGKPGAINTGLFTGVKSVDEAIREKYVGQSGDEAFEQVISTYYDVAAKGRSFGSSPAGERIQSELKSAVTSALTGEKSPKQALADAQKAALSAYNRVAG
ncbi:ABC transporter substrate-binding protein [Schumannella soli]|uniref:Sugar ABC transporter substrate-binding protein n=1 Tax=Schumannella soli TaxID=2590779 RepID=A0A506Y658_9MICO|nr:sugar ABC transporter substrate-binding protein [Schumannella soli]TPW77505.1 sugar ABC transporter substrate-binding protein [Schumannella soli]